MTEHQAELPVLYNSFLLALYFTQGSEILWMEEPGELQSMGSLRVGHD